jgi:hypothetical protein
MKRAVWVAIATGTMISSRRHRRRHRRRRRRPHFEARRHCSRRTRRSAPDRSRYAADRDACEALGGAVRDRCFVDAHARMGRSMLEAAAPYATRAW